MPVEGMTLQPINPAEVPATGGSGGYDGLIEQAAEKNGVESALVRAIIHAESDFNPKAVSKCGAQGLMQLMPGTARALGVQDSFDPAQNINGGTKYLRHLLDQFGDVSQAVAAYNAGPGAVKRYGGVPPFNETQAYVKRVEGYLQTYRNQGK
jgi:soluble lytic murein transglycosylase-like protein